MSYKINSTQILQNYNWYILYSKQEIYLKCCLKLLCIIILSYYFSIFILLVICIYSYYSYLFIIKNKKYCFSKASIVIGKKNIYLYIQDDKGNWQNANFEHGYLLAATIIFTVKVENKKYNFFIFKYKIEPELYKQIRINLHYCMLYSQFKSD